MSVEMMQYLENRRRYLKAFCDHGPDISEVLLSVLREESRKR